VVIDGPNKDCCKSRKQLNPEVFRPDSGYYSHDPAQCDVRDVKGRNQLEYPPGSFLQFRALSARIEQVIYIITNR
jgi:hypothetical protein